ncbi:PEP-CTERM protein-sorting domain-containing protein [Duganella sp. CF458]|uniref:flocculation-associated PEP-CTERM protein PepA n=1 Tax=Duganella sp. CF458 TaxID=1884368 RepID=UPI0008EEBEDC|nr:flocculation-associated PEP-CTERM protein PepA [Duganella sp. CF458]SFG64092.1 PEP-CTERM protein-sorting domain-containing protein [Duganella sp. CF458]
MKVLRKLLPLACAASLLLGVTGAQADVIAPFDIKDGAGNTLASEVTRLDWSSNGTGLARGVGPFATPLTNGQTFEFLYQATMVGKNGGSGTSSLDGRLDGESNGIATGDFEFTIAARMVEQVTFAAGGIATFGLAGTNATNKVAIYFDTQRNANTLTGQGFDDGIMVALLTIDSNTSSFFVFNPGPTNPNGQGSAKLTASIIEAVDFINPDYFEGVMSLIFGMDFESSLNYPAGSASTQGFHRNMSSNNGDPFSTVLPVLSGPGSDIMFKVDGDSGFVAEVPEPGTMLLMGLGLFGLAGMRRRL